MHFFLSCLLTLGIYKTLYSDDLHQAKGKIGKSVPIAIKSVEENKTAILNEGMRVLDSGLSPGTLSKLHNFAKDISHSKGIYRETDKDAVSDDKKEIRRSILKKAAVASESDVMRAILETFHSDENKLQLLEHMEYLVHQYDVAVNFATSGGIKVIIPFLFSSDDKIVSSAASVLGAAMQSNPTVQKIALNQDVGKILLKLLAHRSSDVLSRIIFALASFLRNVPEAQENFIAVNGISKLAMILKNHRIATNTKLKIINLFNDLTVEQETAELYVSDRSAEEISTLKRSFVHEMQKCDICKVIPAFLDLEDFDTHQKIAAAMISLHNVCHNVFKSEVINSRLRKLLKIYDPESDNEDPLYPVIDKDLKKTLYSELKDLIKKINEESIINSNQSMLKVEL